MGEKPEVGKFYKVVKPDDTEEEPGWYESMDPYADGIHECLEIDESDRTVKIRHPNPVEGDYWIHFDWLVDPAAPVVSILDEAKTVVDGPRRETYGHPRENHARTAAMWSAYLGVPISMRDVCQLNSLQKISRDRHKPHRDNLVDQAGWARNAEMVDEA